MIGISVFAVVRVCQIDGEVFSVRLTVAIDAASTSTVSVSRRV